jgi:hypothetical protein
MADKTSIPLITTTDRKTYLGDGVYAAVNRTRGCIELTTENGIEVTNVIYLEIETMTAFLMWFDRLMADVDRRPS